MNWLTTVPGPDNPFDVLAGDGSEIAFHIGSLTIAWYGLFVFFGFVAAIIFAVIKLWKWYKVPVDPFYWFCLMGIPMAIFGARFWSCCLGDAKWNSFWEFKGGGLAIEGGVMFTVLLACWWFPFILKRPKYQIRDLSKDTNKPVIRRVSMWVYVDAVVPCILLGQFFGRWGNYFNQELYGPTLNNDSFCWFLRDCLPRMYINGEWHHPLFFYEALANLAFFLILYFGIEMIPSRKAGDLGIVYFLWYGILRMSLEPLRASQYTFHVTYITTGLWIAAGIIILLLNHLLICKLRNKSPYYFVWEQIRYSRVNRSNITRLKAKNHSLQNKKDSLADVSRQSNASEYKQLSDEITQLNNDIFNLQNKIVIDNKTHELNTKKFTRTEEQMLYYLNK